MPGGMPDARATGTQLCVLSAEIVEGDAGDDEGGGASETTATGTACRPGGRFARSLFAVSGVKRGCVDRRELAGYDSALGAPESALVSRLRRAEGTPCDAREALKFEGDVRRNVLVPDDPSCFFPAMTGRRLAACARNAWAIYMGGSNMRQTWTYGAPLMMRGAGSAANLAAKRILGDINTTEPQGIAYVDFVLDEDGEVVWHAEQEHCAGRLEEVLAKLCDAPAFDERKGYARFTEFGTTYYWKDAFWRLDLIERVHETCPEGGWSRKVARSDAGDSSKAGASASESSLGDSSFSGGDKKAAPEKSGGVAARRDALRAKWLSEEAKREALAASFADVEAAQRRREIELTAEARARRQRELEAAADVGAPTTTATPRGPGASSSSKSRRTTRWTSRRSASARISRSSCPRRSSRSVRTGTGVTCTAAWRTARTSPSSPSRGRFARTCTRRLRATSRSL